jgi:hypothetical protein
MKYNVKRTFITLHNGDRILLKESFSVYGKENLEAIRRYILKQHNAASVNFTYEEIC